MHSVSTHESDIGLVAAVRSLAYLPKLTGLQCMCVICPRPRYLMLLTLELYLYIYFYQFHSLR